jgi:hypothetical protein
MPFQSILSIALVLLVIGLLLGIDYYAFTGIRNVTSGMALGWRRLAYVLYGLTTLVSMSGLVALLLFFTVRNWDWYHLATGLFGWTMTFLVSKLVLVAVLLGYDLINGGWSLVQRVQGDPAASLSRRKFVAQVGLTLASFPFAGMVYGMVKGKYDYRIHRLTLRSKDLPAAFHGFTLAQISDIHSGSFDDHAAVNRGVNMLMAEAPDLIVFTGDLVNEMADEIKPWLETFGRMQAPFGKFSTLGNHDYATHVTLDDQAYAANMQRLFGYHEEMGFRLLNNEHVRLEKDGQYVSLIGVENWGEPPFPQKGDLDLALRGTEEAPFRILLSHDPTHFDHKVVPHPLPVHLTLSGHTHGMQFGIETAGIKWSPVKYRYPRWAGLYEEANQWLYVNRGFGFIGFPGRVGIWPEITIITLEQA